MSKRAYHRQPDGTVRRIALVRQDDGRVILNRGAPCEITRTGTTKLLGWGKDDGPAGVYMTDGAQEILIPERGVVDALAEAAS